MRRIRIIHSLRQILAVALFGLIFGAAALLWWANETGLPKSWRDGVEQALAAYGIHAEVASLRYLPLRGIEAGEVTIYTDETRSRTITRLEKLIFEVDRTRLARGDIRIHKLNLSGAKVSLAADPEDPDSKVLEINDLSGRIQLSGRRDVEISKASGMVGGIRLELNAILKTFGPGRVRTEEQQDDAKEDREKALLAIIDGLESAALESENPPLIRIDARGDLQERESLRIAVSVKGQDFKSRNLLIRELDFQGELYGRLLVVHEGHILTEHGSITGQLEYDFDNSAGRFDFQSDMGIKESMEHLNIPMPDKVPSFGSPPRINAHGEFRRNGDAWKYQLMGDVELEKPSFQQFAVDWISTRFSWDGSRLLLEDLTVTHEGRELSGRVFHDSGIIRYQVESDLPAEFWQNAVTFKPLRMVLNDFKSEEGADALLTCEGKANLNDPRDWFFRGSASVKNTSYRGIPANYAEVRMDLSHGSYRFINGTAELDFSDYGLRKKYGGAASGQIQVDEVAWLPEQGVVTIDNLRGRSWPAPILRMFAVDVANNMEIYEFHEPPAITANGVIGVIDGMSKQDLRVDFETSQAANYEFLDADLELNAPRGSVRVYSDKVEVSGLSFNVFNGRIRADLVSGLKGGKQTNVSGELDWTSLDLPAIATAYGFKSKPEGVITGRIDFQLNGDTVAGLDGEGVVALENAELFEVPMFGPLSPLISAVLGKRFGGIQEATSAFCNYRIEDGELSTGNFLTTTTSLVFTGDGSVDLTKKELDFTIRMNARGFLGVITLPLRPLYGLFQFRGQGPIEKPEWENVIFTSPPPEQENQLLKPPKAKPVEPLPNAR